MANLSYSYPAGNATPAVFWAEAAGEAELRRNAAVKPVGYLPTAIQLEFIVIPE